MRLQCRKVCLQCRRGSFHPWVRKISPGEGNGNPLQYSSLENRQRSLMACSAGGRKGSDTTGATKPPASGALPGEQRERRPCPPLPLLSLTLLPRARGSQRQLWGSAHSTQRERASSLPGEMLAASPTCGARAKRSPRMQCR